MNKLLRRNTLLINCNFSVYVVLERNNYFLLLLVRLIPPSTLHLTNDFILPVVYSLEPPSRTIRGLSVDYRKITNCYGYSYFSVYMPCSCSNKTSLETYYQKKSYTIFVEKRYVYYANIAISCTPSPVLAPTVSFSPRTSSPEI